MDLVYAVRRNFWKDKFCTQATRLHGTGYSTVHAQKLARFLGSRINKRPIRVSFCGPVQKQISGPVKKGP